MPDYHVFAAACLLILVTISQLGMGLLIESFLRAVSAKESSQLPDTDNIPGLFLFGLLAYLSLLLVLRTLSVPLQAAVLVSALPGLCSAKELLRLCGQFKFKVSFNFLLWLTVVVPTGFCLFWAKGGITTPWATNLSDLSFHFSVITALVQQSAFPPGHPLMAGEPLSYPFYIDLWSAALWFTHQSWQFLSVIFAYQWILLWLVVYFLLRRFPILPWALFFGGGSYFTLGHFSWEIIDHGFPWSVFLTTVWTTQRSSLLGVCVLLFAVKTIYRIESRDASKAFKRLNAVKGGSILALAVLSHTHLFLISVLFITLKLSAPLVKCCLKSGIKAKTLADSELAVFICALSPAVLFVPFIISKAGIASIVSGWAVYSADPVFQAAPPQTSWSRLFESVKMWTLNTPVVFSAVIYYWKKTGRKAEVFILAALFFLGNVVQLSYWSWDQQKIFLGIYVLIVALMEMHCLQRNFATAIISVLLIIPGLLEAAKVLWQHKAFAVYTQPKLEIARKIAELTPPDSVIAAKPFPDSPVTLSGRALFMGYVGTLWSHGLDFKARAELLLDLDKLGRCTERLEAADCPTYLLWTKAEQSFWGRPSPGPSYEPTNLKFLYKISAH